VNFTLTAEVRLKKVNKKERSRRHRSSERKEVYERKEMKWPDARPSQKTINEEGKRGQKERDRGELEAIRNLA